ncbi:hypothetical protein B0H17DRAFT_1094379 [Mycena rosella]|uniref:Uncharacterized protein n=1 Tax=Mycena rosella TaxID=1033263 RepID=A0AAD7CW73_MYCRO|nr:hypothetical protein B0H17DRAFT_1094379 [Mycena rosella]
MLSFRRAFSVNPAVLAPGHPYSFDSAGKSCQVSFFEFRAMGPPTSSFGYAGDVYVDLTPGAHALYWRDRHGRGPGQWRRWTALLLDRVPLYKYLITHPWADDPQESDLYLWVDPHGVTWTSRAEICASRVLMIQKAVATIKPGERHPDVEALVSEILMKMIEAEDQTTLPPIQDKRDRYSGTSPQLPSLSRSIAEQRERSHSSGSRPSPPETHFRPREPLPSPSNSPSARRRTLPSPVHFGPGPSSTKRPPSPLYTPSHYPRHPARIRPPSPPPPPASDPRHPHPITTAEPFHRQAPTPYPDYPVAGPSNPRAQESPPPPPPLNPHPGATEQELRESFAWNEMQRAQYAEAHFKRELRLKNRELSKFKKKEKDVISMSFMYQKKEQELMEALASVEQRSHAELEEQRAAVRAAQRKVEEAEQQTRDEARELRRLEEALSEARKEINELKSCKLVKAHCLPHEACTSPIDADMVEAENGGLKEEMTRMSAARNRPPSREL